MADLVTWLRCKARVFEVYGQEKSGWAKLHTADLNAYSGKLREAADALEAAREDAERYRWLRSLDGSYDAAACVNINIGFDWIEQHGAELDAAIDAAREARNG